MPEKDIRNSGIRFNYKLLDFERFGEARAIFRARFRGYELSKRIQSARELAMERERKEIRKQQIVRRESQSDLSLYD